MTLIVKSVLVHKECYRLIKIAFLILSATIVGGCEEKKTEAQVIDAQNPEIQEPSWRKWIPMEGTFDLTVLGREEHTKDLLLVHHGKNTFEIIHQEALRQI